MRAGAVSEKSGSVTVGLDAASREVARITVRLKPDTIYGLDYGAWKGVC